MKRLRTTAVVGALLAIVVAPLAYASGLWFGLPVVGGSSYCSGLVGTGTNPTTGIGTSGLTTTCATTVPAGPTTTTGLEMIPADLQVGQTAGSAGPGNAPTQSGPSTAYLPLPTVASGAYLLTNTGGLSAAVTLTVPNSISNVILNATGTITDYTLNLPVNPFDGQLVRFSTLATITTIHVTSTGAAVGGVAVSVDTPTKVFSPVVPTSETGLSVTSATVVGFSYLYNLSGNRWMRMN